MTCGKKHKTNTAVTAEADRIDFAEVDGRPRCRNMWCRRPLRDGECSRGCAQSGPLSFADASMEVPLGVDTMGEASWAALALAYAAQGLDYAATVRVLRLAQHLAGEEEIGADNIAQALQMHQDKPVNRVGSGEGAAPETIAGHPELKRAVELALAGGHPLGLLFDESCAGDAWLLAEWARNQGVGVRMTTRCACGQPPSKCTCKDADRERWQQVSFYAGVQGSTLVVDITPPAWENTQHWLTGTISPVSLAQEAAIPERAFTARQQDPVTLTDPDTDMLLQAAGRDLALTPEAQAEVRSLASTAARLEGAGSIQLRHMVEALKFFPRGRSAAPAPSTASEVALAVPPELAAAAASRTKIPGDELYQLVRDRLTQLAAEVDATIVSAEMQAYIEAMIRFHRYSFNNQWLIQLQCYMRGINPHQLVAAAADWQKRGRLIKKDERGLQIIWGRPRQRQVKVRDEATGEERWEEVRWMDFGGGNVFLESQTEGQPLPAMPQREVAEVGAELDRRVVTLIERQGILFEEVATVSSKISGMAARGTLREPQRDTPPEVTMVVRRANEAQQQRLRVGLHELAHVQLGHLDKQGALPKSQRELEADACAYVVAQHFGYDLGTVPNYIALHGGAGPQLHQSMERIAKTAKQMIEQIEALEEDTPTATMRLAA